MDELKNGDEISHLKLKEALSMPGWSEKSIHAEKQKVRIVKHAEGAMLEHRGELWWIPSSAIQAAKKAPGQVAKQDAPAEPQMTEQTLSQVFPEPMEAKESEIAPEAASAVETKAKRLFGYKKK